MGAMTPPSRKSCYNFRVTEINRVLDGDTIDVTIDLGFDLYKKERVRVAGVGVPAVIGIPYVGWLAAGWVSLLGGRLGSEAGSTVGSVFNDC